MCIRDSAEYGAHNVYRMAMAIKGKKVVSANSTDEFGMSVKDTNGFTGYTFDADVSKVDWSIADEYDENTYRTLALLMGKAPLHILELCGAEQVKPLRERNVDSYFKMAKSEMPTTRIHQVVMFIAANIKMMITDDDFQQHTKTVNWVGYHTQAASTQSLCRKFMDETKDFLNWQDNTKKAIKDACDAPWDKGRIDLIPLKVVQLCYCYLQATKQLPDNWYMGQRAIGQMKTSDMVKYRAVFAKFAELEANIVGLDQVGEVDDLKAKIDVDI
eukprot:TRINITY_DN7200_c0_g1_i4.p1 TRINITY_DN7200_c0_g1~~TRINITY_DN7200_c0_g1_i4.p1  ORF type:complete len:272 (-),score=26.25 TRINITY_DN7200_c0_g1_i4:330-1145(-)